MKLKQLMEGISSILYHATTAEAGVSILQSDTLHSPTGHVSFTRSLTGSYHSKNKMVGVIFKFDGRKLQHHYKGSPIDSENEWFRENPWKEDGEVYARDPDSYMYGQLEDRLRINSEELEKATSYITGAIVYFPQEYYGAGQQADSLDIPYRRSFSQVRALIKQLNSRGIQFRTVLRHKDLFNKSVDDTQKLIRISDTMVDPDFDHYT